MTSIDRRAFVAGAGSLALAGCARRLSGEGAASASIAYEGDTYRNEVPGYGPLREDPAGVFDLPAGFSYRIISRRGERMDDGLAVPGKMDGMAAFPAPRGKVLLVRNHELNARNGDIGPLMRGGSIDPARVFDSADGAPLPGGTTTMLYDPTSGRVERQHLSLVGTMVNCAGGATPWGSWLTCEENVDTIGRAHGWVFEVPAAATGLADPVPLTALGRFKHEAAAVDPRTGIVYLTEDRDDGLFYRFLPARPGRLREGGRLEALAFVDGGRDSRNWDSVEFADRAWRDVRWIPLDRPEAPGDDLRDRGHRAGAARFARGEGIHWGAGELYFTCTSGGAAKIGQIMRLVPGRGGQADRLQLFLESRDRKLLDFGDNLTVAPDGQLIVCEDKYTADAVDHLKSITPDGRSYTLGRARHPDTGELAGVCFSPDGGTLFVNLYKVGYTLAIRGPWMRFDGRG